MEVKYLERAGVQFASKAECAQVNMGFPNDSTGECTCCSQPHKQTQSTGEYQRFAGSVAFSCGSGQNVALIPMCSCQPAIGTDYWSERTRQQIESESVERESCCNCSTASVFIVLIQRRERRGEEVGLCVCLIYPLEDVVYWTE